MDEGFPARPQPARRRSGTAPLGFALGGFLIGAAAVWALAGTPGLRGIDMLSLGQEAQQEPAQAATSRPAASGAAEAEARQAVQQVAAVAQQQGGLDQRVAAMEQRLARLDLQAQAAAGNAARAEGLLIAFAARRTLERGEPLGYLADQLRLRFADARPNAVQIVLDAARDPVTLDQLVARLEGMAPTLAQVPRSEGAFSWLSREISDLFVVRRRDAPSPAAVNRLSRARLFLESGRVDAAAAEVRQLPNATAARDWVADANRYAAAQRALDLIETTAILEPRELRDDTGQAVQQPSPVG
jgi:hypothetical protein